MCVPECFIREDGKGFIVRKGGIDWDVWSEDGDRKWYAARSKVYGELWGHGMSIMEAVDNVLAKVRAAEITEASIQEGKREA